MFTLGTKNRMVDRQNALPGRADRMPVAGRHRVLDAPLQEPEPGYFATRGLKQAVFGLGCFWGAEKAFWQLQGVYTTAAGYAGGYTPNPTYQEVCSGQTGHAEVVWVVFDPLEISYERLLEQFWQAHDPTQGMRQGNDQGTQYRSIILTFDQEQGELANSSMSHYQQKLAAEGYPVITTEIVALDEFYYAEDYHQQYLAKHPDGYCGLGGTGVCYR